MDNFGAVLGGVASALAVFAALAAIWRWSRAWRQRLRLRSTVREIEKAAAALSALVVQIDHRMSEGVGWGGWAVWPDSLGPHIAALNEHILDAEAIAARVRGISAEPRLERLRADTESGALLLRHAAEIYRSGTITNYRMIEGKPVPPGATGRDVTAALQLENEGLLRQTSRDFTHLVRSCLYQVGEEADARAYEVDWPVSRADIFTADPDWIYPQFPPGTEQAPPFGAY